MFDLLHSTYQMAAPGTAADDIDRIIEGALARAREKHADWEHFALGIEFLSSVFFTDHHKMPLDDYLESLYCAVKHGDFSKPWRAELRRMRAETEQPAAVQ